jgi:hypothetical protein
MRHLSSFATTQDGFRTAAASRSAVEHRPPFMIWLALVAGVAICAIALLLL